MRYLLLTTILLMACVSAPANAAQPELAELTPQFIARDVLEAQPLGPGRFIYSTIDADGRFDGFRLYDIASGTTLPWLHNWVPEHDGWDVPDYGLPLGLTTSSDGSWVAFASPVSVPLDITLSNDVPRTAYVILVCDAGGDVAYPVAITVQVGSGPHITFSYDAQRLVFSPAMPCDPTAEAYAAYINSGFALPAGPAPNYIELSELTLSHDPLLELHDPLLELSDGIERCPFSDYYRVETNDSRLLILRSFSQPTLRTAHTFSEVQSVSFATWVKPDAVLVTLDSESQLVYCNGRTAIVPVGGYKYLAWLGGATYLVAAPGSDSLYVCRHDWQHAPGVASRIQLEHTDSWVRAAAAPGANAFMLMLGGTGYIEPARLLAVPLPHD